MKNSITFFSFPFRSLELVTMMMLSTLCNKSFEKKGMYSLRRTTTTRRVEKSATTTKCEIKELTSWIAEIIFHFSLCCWYSSWVICNTKSLPSFTFIEDFFQLLLLCHHYCVRKMCELPSWFFISISLQLLKCSIINFGGYSELLLMKGWIEN